MKKSIIISLFSVLGIGLLTTCTEDFTETNTNPLALSTAALEGNEGLQGQAFAQAQFYGVAAYEDFYQISQNLFADLWCQYFATTQSFFDSDRYVQVGSWSNSAWGAFYGRAAPQIKLVEDLTEQDGNEVGNAMAKIWRVFAYHRITDYWGPIPYSEFGNGELSVDYDPQEEIYNDFFVTLDEAVAQLKANPGEVSFGANDGIYGGNGDQWLTLANSLRLRLALRIRFADPEKARTEAEKAVADGVMTDNADNASVAVGPILRNPLGVITDWGEFRMSASMESVLEGYEDPRLPTYFSPAEEGDTDGDGMPYEGLLNGQFRSVLEQGQNDNHSDLGQQFLPEPRGGENGPLEIMNAAEMYFLRAEGALVGWNMDGTAQELYEQGIRTSMQQNSAATDDEITAYINSSNQPVPYAPDAAPLTDIPVAFAADTEQQLEQIITQKWLALYPNGWEAWAELRRTGYPKQYARVTSDNTDVAADEIVRRMVYVGDEFDTNEAAVNAAIALPEMAGGDKNSTRLWWDKR